MSYEPPNSGLESLLSTPLDKEVSVKILSKLFINSNAEQAGIRCFLGDEFSLGPAARLVSPGVQNVR